MQFTEFFRQRRMELGYTARKFAAEKGYDVGYISRLENGIVAPPSEHEKVAALARALEIEEGSKMWGEFFDAVAIARNEIPEDLRDDKVAISMLPAFYRGLRNKSLDEEEVKELLKLLEDSRKE